MAHFIMTLSREVFFQLLSFAPEAMKTCVEEKAKRAIPALCFTEEDIRQTFAEDERWNNLSDEAQREAIEAVICADQYKEAGIVANQSIAEAVARYLREAFIEEAGEKAGRDFTW